MALPLLVLMTIGLVWVLSLGAAQLRLVDAARETARAVARGDDVAVAVAAGERVAPSGGRIVVTSEGTDGEVVAAASAQIEGPGGFFDWLPGVTLEAQAVAVSETQP